MSSANEKQIAGKHYSSEYQHWDFVCDTGLHYLLGCATKYVIRYNNKNGIEDLQKAQHYLQKAIERKIPAVMKRADLMEQPFWLLWLKFFNIKVDCGQVEPFSKEAEIYLRILVGDYELAIGEIDTLIHKLVHGNGG